MKGVRQLPPSLLLTGSDSREWKGTPSQPDRMGGPDLLPIGSICL